MVGAFASDTDGLVDGIAGTGALGNDTGERIDGAFVGETDGLVDSIAGIGVVDGTITKSEPPGDTPFPPVGPPGSIASCGCPYSPDFEASFCRSFNRTVTTTTAKLKIHKMRMLSRRMTALRL